tara:strand:- start:937 stop:1104 length:168 start_codon:yes stop_codon:yes gene_type:complete
MNKPNQFKIETPALSVESDSGNHVVDVLSVVLVCSVFVIGMKILSIWVKGIMKRG